MCMVAQVRVYDVRTGECSSAFGLGSAADVAVHTVLVLPDKISAELRASSSTTSSASSPGASSGPLVLAVGRSPVAHVVTLAGAVVRTLSVGSPSERAAGLDLVAAALSPSGGLAYVASEDGKAYCFDLNHPDGAQLQNTFSVVDAAGAGADESAAPLAKRAKRSTEVLGLAHHPHRNRLASGAAEGALRIWRP